MPIDFKRSRYTGLVVLMVFCFFSSSGKGQERKANDRDTIRVLSFNILHGATTNDTYDLDLIAEMIDRTNPDLVALQEVDFMTKRSRGLDIATEMAIRTKMAPYFAKAMKYDGGEFGVALLSRYPYSETLNYPLPHKSQNEPRTLAAAKIMLHSGETIQFFGTHLDYHSKDGERISQAKAINALIDGSEIPSILAGDLNDLPGSRTIELLETKWNSASQKDHAAPTFPSNSPVKKIDYVMYYPKKRWNVLQREVLCNEIASDHCAFLVVLELLPSISKE